MLVKFIAVDNKKLIDDNYTYIDDIYKVIRTGGLIKNLNIDPDAAAFGVGAVREVDEDGNVFVLEFNSADGEKSNIWSVYFAYGTYNNSKQLEISIYSDTYVPKVDEGYLEKLKIRIKKSISKDWERIIWLVDKDSECLSICLYPQIYKVENLMREVIENLRFRNDLEIMVHYSETEDNGELFSVKSKIDDVCLKFSYDMQIDDSEGADSSLDISCDNEKFCTSVGYCNGAVEYDEESGLYMPITEDEIGDVGNTVDEILDLISRELPNYMENAEPEDIAECLYCCECGEEAICINEGILPIGTCMNCGYVNAVYECEMCHSWFNCDEDGRVTDDIAFCQNCLDRMEEE